MELCARTSSSVSKQTVAWVKGAKMKGAVNFCSILFCLSARLGKFSVEIFPVLHEMSTLLSALPGRYRETGATQGCFFAFKNQVFSCVLMLWVTKAAVVAFQKGVPLLQVW